MSKFLDISRSLADSCLAVLKTPKRLANVARLSHVINFLYMLRNGDRALIRDRLDLYFRQGPRVSDITWLDTTSAVFPLVFPVVDAPRISIIVPVYNGYEYTLSCLMAIERHTERLDYEVILADDASTDETLSIQAVVHNLRIVRAPRNLGFLGNCNFAAQHARGNILVLLNNDTNVQPGWLTPLVETLESDECVGMVGSMLLYPDGTLQEAGGIIWKDASGWNYGNQQSPDRPEFTYLKEVDFVSGACIAIRAALWQQLGGFDERFSPAYYEDVDLAFALRSLGYRALYQPQSRVVHFEGKSHGTDVKRGVKQYQEVNRQVFRDKWADTLDREHASGPTFLFTARDRSANRQTILVIDHYVPKPDRDAGSKMVFSYLRLLVQMGYNVKFLGDNFHNEEPYTSNLEQLGIEVLSGVWYRDHHKDWIATNLKFIDHVVLCRPHISRKYIELFKGNIQGKIIYFGIDLHYLREKRRYEVEGVHQHLEMAHRWKKLETSLIERADISITPSDFERQEIETLCPKKKVVTVPLFFYESNEKVDSGFDERADIAFVGGFSHPPNTQGILWFLANVWPTLKQRLSCKLYIIGANPPESVLSFQSDHVQVTGAVSEEQLLAYYRTCRVFVAPLLFGAGVKGKVVEAMKHQVPLVGTSISYEGLPGLATYPQIRPCDEPSTFSVEIERLYTGKADWHALSESYYNYINQYFRVDSAREKVEAILNQHEVLPA